MYELSNSATHQRIGFLVLTLIFTFVLNTYYPKEVAASEAVEKKIEIITEQTTAETETTTEIETTTEVKTTNEIKIITEDSPPTAAEPAITEVEITTAVAKNHAYECLGPDMISFIQGVAIDYGIDSNIIFAVINVESGFNLYADNGQGCVGPMQIATSNYSWLHDAIGITDLRDPYQNIKAGCYILRYYLNQGYSIESALVAYNTGSYGTSSWYSRKVLAIAASFE